MNTKWYVCLFAGFVWTSHSWCAGNPTAGLGLPESIQSTLNEEYPGWKLAPVTPQIQATYKQHKVTHSPSVAAGDFDHDGQRDYAVQIILNTPGQEEQIIIAFLARAGHFEETILQSMGIDPTNSLWVMRVSIDETGANPDKPEKKDVLMVLGGPVGDTVYSYDAGKFHEIASPDDSEHPDPSIPRTSPPPEPAPEKMAP
jgi:hypothetical protein